ncbi:MAG: heparinase II/III family protein [Bacteroidales bacterium]|nr:heparinase II/III family protein [Bacteroidales bacterium]
MIRLFPTVFILFCALFLVDAQQKSVSQSVLAKRKDAEIGAKPCRYDNRSRPGILVTPERLSLVRNDILHKKSERRLIYEKYVKADADLWLDRSIDIPDMGGWLHDYFCTEGSMLEIPADKIFRDDVPSKCPVCGKTYINDKVLAARKSIIHYWLCAAVRNLSLVYAIEGKKEYAEKAIEILTKYADAYPHQTILRQTLEEAVVLIPLAEGYDLLFDVMTEKQRSHIEQHLLWPAAQMLSKSGMGGNWGSWHLSAVGVIGYATRHQRFIDFATEQFKLQITNQLGDDGLWPESVHTYHFYPLNGFLSFVEAATNNGDDLYQWEVKQGKGIKKMLTAPLRYVYPDMRLAAINDGWYDSYLPQDHYTVGYYRYRLPEFAWAVQQVCRGGKSGMLGDMLDPHYRNVLYGEEFPRRLPKPIFESIDFPVLGIAVLRQGSGLPMEKEMVMTFDYGPFLGHGHPDKMGITLFAKGKLLVADYGTTGYASPSNVFLKSTHSHNTIVIDGKRHPATKDRNLTVFEITPSFKLASASTVEIAEGTHWTRTVMMTGEYAVIWDRIEGDKEHCFDWFFHAEGQSVLLNGKDVPLSEKEFTYPSITDVRKQDISGESGKAYWENEDHALDVRFKNITGQKAFISNMPTGEETRQIPLLVLRQESKKAEFLSVIRPLKGKKEKSIDYNIQFQQEVNGESSIIVSSGKVKDKIIFAKERVIYEKDGQKPVEVKCK